jgi:glycosyltransferase involved in cell wall biosynthesis
MNGAPLVSVICAAWNAERTIADTVRSVLAQEHTHWELLIGDDGSTDGTAAIARSFQDPRIHCIELPHRGVAATRNALLERMRGDHFCFVDADDVLPPGSITARLKILQQDASAAFADGVVELRDASMTRVTGRWTPTATGDPLPHLLALDGRVFLGNTWLVRRRAGQAYRFESGLTHGEDLLFCISIADGSRYVFTDEVVLWYRRGDGGAMRDLRGLENGYAQVYLHLCRTRLRTLPQRTRFKLRIMRIMAASYMKDGRSPLAALRAVVRYAFLSASSSNTRS